MGQQQLLLIVLGVILVGVAVVLGIQYFGVGAEEGVKDEAVAHLQILAANAQQWYSKPASLGGGGGAFDITYNSINGPWDVPDRLRATTNVGHISADGTIGTPYGYQAAVTPQQVIITAYPNDYTWTAQATVTPINVTIKVIPGT